MDNIRSINSSLAFASMGAQIAPPPGYSPYCFRINGSIYHCAGALHPENGEPRKYAQFYILDSQEAAVQRLQLHENQGCQPCLMQTWSAWMATPLLMPARCFMRSSRRAFKMLTYAMQSPPLYLWLSFRTMRKTHEDTTHHDPMKLPLYFRMQTVSLHCTVTSSLTAAQRQTDSRKTECIRILDPNLEAMVYPLLFLYGDQIWGIEIPLLDRPPTVFAVCFPSLNPQSKVTQMQ